MRRVDGVAVACRCRAALDLRLQCQMLPPLCQPSHGGATSSNDGCGAIIRNARVSAGMVATALCFTVCSCYNRLEMLALLVTMAPPAEGSVSGNDPSENRSLRRMRRQFRESGHPARRLAAPQTRAASRAQTAARRQRPHQATAYGSPLTPSRYRRAAAAPPATHNSQRQRSPSKPQP